MKSYTKARYFNHLITAIHRDGTLGHVHGCSAKLAVSCDGHPLILAQTHTLLKENSWVTVMLGDLGSIPAFPILVEFFFSFISATQIEAIVCYYVQPCIAKSARLHPTMLSAILNQQRDDPIVAYIWLFSEAGCRTVWSPSVLVAVFCRKKLAGARLWGS